MCYESHNKVWGSEPLEPQCLVSHRPVTRLGSPRPKSCVCLSSVYCPARSWVLAQEAEIPGIPIPPSPWHRRRRPPPPPPLTTPFSTNPQAPLPLCLLGGGAGWGCRRHETVGLKEGFWGGLEQPGGEGSRGEAHV